MQISLVLICQKLVKTKDCECSFQITKVHVCLKLRRAFWLLSCFHLKQSASFFMSAVSQEVRRYCVGD